MPEDNELHFKTNVQLKSIIGKDLINDDNIAILELVKNSFDADAKNVSVKYLNLTKNDDLHTNEFSARTSRLIIQDNGVGMSLQDIEDKWLNIAYSEKKSNPLQHKRRMAGAKGVGRFSCDRLGEFLNLYSKKENENHYTKLSINWKLFEVEDNKKEIQSIPLSCQTLSSVEFSNLGFENFEHGVLLEIIKLRSTWVYRIEDKDGNFQRWDIQKLTNLKKYLEKLINPSQAFENDDFGVYIDAPEFISENDALEEHDKFIGRVENRVFDKLDFKSTSIETKTIDGGKNLYTILKDKGEIVFWINEKNPYYPFIKNIKASIYYLNPYAKAFFTRQTGIESVNYGSLFLFINGFRIYPYGEVGNDWLGLDQRKAQGTQRYLGLRDIIGQIEVIDEENDFQIISSREGIVRNDNYKNLTNSERNDSFYYKAHRRLERYVVEGLNWDSSIFDNKDPRFKEIEQKIIAGKASEEELRYREDDETKQRRVYSAIHGIISARPIDVNELYINENLITSKIEEEKRRAEIEFEQLLEDFERKKIDSDTLERILARKAEQNAELQKQIKEFSKYSTSEATSKAILELQNYQKTIEEQKRLIEQLQKRLEDIENEKKDAEEKVETYKAKAEQVETELSLERQKTSYLLATRRTLSPDADGLIHTIKINNIEIRDGIDNILNDLMDDNFSKESLIKRLGYIKVNAERSLKLTEIATRSDFNEDIERRNIELVTYIREYIDLYGETFSDNIEFDVKENNAHCVKNLSVLNLSIVLDNLISNAVKWGATEILFDFQQLDSTRILMNVSDNGIGLAQKFAGNEDKIFDLSARESSPTGIGGSGIGLYYTRNLLREMNSTIKFSGNSKFLSGASFEIIFN